MIFDDQVIGVVVRHGYNDYELLLTSFSEEDSFAIYDILAPYEDDMSGIRGDKNISLNDANIDWWEKDERPRYRATDNPNDIVYIEKIFERYMAINGSCDGFEDYVHSGFMNGNEVEYIKVE